MQLNLLEAKVVHNLNMTTNERGFIFCSVKVLEKPQRLFYLIS